MSGWVDWDFELNSTLGPVLQAAYFWAPEEYYDFTFTPRFHPTSGLTLDTEYNRALSLGDLKARSLFSYMPEFLNGGDPVLSDYGSPLYSAFALEGDFDLSTNWRMQVDGVWYSHEDLLNLHGWSTASTQNSEFLIEGFHDRSYT